MSLTSVVYMAVRVLERDKDGTLIKWRHTGDQRKWPCIDDAVTDMVRLSKKFPGVPCAVIRRAISEIKVTDSVKLWHQQMLEPSQEILKEP